MKRYATNTKVPVERSKAEIERTLKRYGIDEFFYGTSPRGDGIAFKHDGKAFKLNVPKINPDDFRTDLQYKQAQRQRYRVLVLTLKAKLEAIENGLTNFDIEFLGYMALPNGTTVAEQVLPEIQRSIESGKKPKLLLAGM